MSKGEFMKELEYLLSDIPEEDKRDALAYYEDYLEEAGETAEQAIAEFGSPERIAAIIRADLQGNLEDGGEFTERGYEDERFRDPNFQMAKRYDLPEVNEGQEEKKNNSQEGVKDRTRTDREDKEANQRQGWKTLVLILLVLAASPILLGLGGAVLGAVAGVGGGILGIIAGAVALVFGLAVVLIVLTVTLLLAGIAICAVGVIAMFSNVLNGLLCFGAGLVVLSFGFLCLLISAWFYGKMIPWLIRTCVNGVSRLVHRRERVA